MIVTAQDILSVIPQRPPFVMIDELVDCTDTSTTSAFEVRADNVLVNNSYFTEAGLMENIAQTAAAGVGYKAQQNNEPVLIGYIGAVKNFEIMALPKVGDVITTQVVITNQIFDATIVNGSITCNDVVLANCEMKIFIKK